MKDFNSSFVEKWGDSDMFIDDEKKTQNCDMKREKEMLDTGNRILKAFGEAVGQEPGNTHVQGLVRMWQEYITEYQYECTKDILKQLGEMYINDKRFSQVLEQNGKGTAQLMHDSIMVYCEDK